MTSKLYGNAGKKYQHEYHLAHRDAILVKKSEYRLANKDAIQEKDRQRYAANPTKRRATTQRWKSNNPDKMRASYLLRIFGITLDDFNAMWKKQNGRCAICDCKLILGGKKKNSVHIDHCHKNGRVRGLLCFGCNLGIGFLGDDPNRIRRAAEYLEGEVK